MKKMFILCITLFAFCSCGEKTNNYSSQINQTETSEVNEITTAETKSTTEAETSTEETSEPPLIITEPITSIPVTTQSTPTLTIESCTRDHDDNYGAVLTVIYKFTNTTDKEYSFSDLFLDTVIQAPYTLPCLYVDIEAKLQRIQPNESISIKHTYHIIDECMISPFEISVTGFEYNMSNKQYLNTYLYKAYDYKVTPETEN